MPGPIKYLVELQCQPSPMGYEQQITRALASRFDIVGCQCTSDGVSIELTSGHSVAYGAFKDLADLVIETISRTEARLICGVINRVDHGRLAAVADTLGQNRSSGDLGFWSLLFGGLVKKAMDKITGGTRLRPVMYFYQGIVLDLQLAAKASNLRLEPLPEPN